MAYCFITLGLVSTALAGTLPHSFSKRDTFNWGSIGDSWTSGVAYSDDNAWDNNAGSCLRSKDAWSVQLGFDTTWAQNPQNWIFNGCSGSVLGDMHGYGQNGRQLINAISNTPQIIFMSAGGNNAFFGEIVTNCIYHPYPTTNYGFNYGDDPLCLGECCQSLQKADDYINKQGDGGFFQDVLNTINDVMGTPQANGGAQFFLYMNGYAQFFNEDTTGDGTCDTWSFALIGNVYDDSDNELTVNQALRKRMNSLVLNLNQVTQNAINAWQPDITRQTEQYPVFVDLDPYFNNHRFCEPGDGYNDQWYSDNVWIWNLQVGDYQGQDITGGSFVPADPEIQPFSGSLGEGPSGGWKVRPFHPKFQGHTAIKNAIIAKMRVSGMPGVTPSPTTHVPGQCGFHLREEWAKQRSQGTAYITITNLYDGGGNNIGYLDKTEIDNVPSVGMDSALPFVVVVTPWDSGEDYDSFNYYNLRFDYAGMEWTTFDDHGPAHCTVGGRDSPSDNLMTQDMDCVFPC